MVAHVFGALFAGKPAVIFLYFEKNATTGILGFIVCLTRVFFLAHRLGYFILLMQFILMANQLFLLFYNSFWPESDIFKGPRASGNGSRKWRRCAKL